MTRLDAVAMSPADGTAGSGESEIFDSIPTLQSWSPRWTRSCVRHLLPSVGQQTSPAIGSALAKNRRVVGRDVRRCAPRHRPVRPVRALERSPRVTVPPRPTATDDEGR